MKLRRANEGNTILRSSTLSEKLDSAAFYRQMGEISCSFLDVFRSCLQEPFSEKCSKEWKATFLTTEYKPCSRLSLIVTDHIGLDTQVHVTHNCFVTVTRNKLNKSSKVHRIIQQLGYPLTWQLTGHEIINIKNDAIIPNTTCEKFSEVMLSIQLTQAVQCNAAFWYVWRT